MGRRDGEFLDEFGGVMREFAGGLVEDEGVEVGSIKRRGDLIGRRMGWSRASDWGLAGEERINRRQNVLG